MWHSVILKILNLYINNDMFSIQLVITINILSINGITKVKIDNGNINNDTIGTYNKLIKIDNALILKLLLILIGNPAKKEIIDTFNKLLNLLLFLLQYFNK